MGLLLRRGWLGDWIDGGEERGGKEHRWSDAVGRWYRRKREGEGQCVVG